MFRRCSCTPSCTVCNAVSPRHSVSARLDYLILWVQSRRTILSVCALGLLLSVCHISSIYEFPLAIFTGETRKVYEQPWFPSAEKFPASREISTYLHSAASSVNLRTMKMSKCSNPRLPVKSIFSIPQHLTWYTWQCGVGPTSTKFLFLLVFLFFLEIRQTGLCFMIFVRNHRMLMKQLSVMNMGKSKFDSRSQNLSDDIVHSTPRKLPQRSPQSTSNGTPCTSCFKVSCCTWTSPPSY